MNNNAEKISEILLKLRLDSIQANASHDVRSVMDKYNMLFVGEKFNTIYSLELLNTLNTFFNFDISRDELNTLIPIVCKSLNMKFDSLVKVSDLDCVDPPIAGFCILLW
ncbi:MAG: hypothetical protein RR835_03970 [Peptostreptococcaceae bacterium]